ncbi:MAG: L-serine dehydratase, iron-sulfur-dependent subunit alpha [Verrucomicrobia bacterium RIFCSPHIGHO2_12_FULL_41_10]|nr:MAG: L-serine dehydratase, iron-sulfur-dependent subunit alpha [Verrucomicrobia bacterium RIFCSPHIGHO2_12_FULL_41_10]HLB34234.1 L-serine ammonia-lyase, iron-sulfur-dependent, subunit alpha [Chthoniobacterales bacterium]
METQFRTAVQLLDLCRTKQVSIAELTVQSEIESGTLSREEIEDRMVLYYGRMKESVKKGLEITERSRSGLSGGDSRRVLAHSQGSKVSVLGSIFERSIAYAFAVLETNAAFGRIIATPTAGSAGICPACLLIWQEERHATDEVTMRGLFTAAGIGKIIGHGACFSGAQGGCQAEVGSASAMAAAAICELDGGTPEEVVNAAALALQNTLGLICDPIGGYVEAPCMMRNGLFGLHSFGASAISLSGVKSIVPFDEVVGALREVGNKMPRMYKETSEGGLANTPTGLQFKNSLKVKG